MKTFKEFLLEKLTEDDFFILQKYADYFIEKNYWNKKYHVID